LLQLHSICDICYFPFLFFAGFGSGAASDGPREFLGRPAFGPSAGGGIADDSLNASHDTPSAAASF
jgi:hypothetical protein